MSIGNQFGRPIEILLVDDNPGDVELTRQGLVEGKVSNNLNVVADGVEALRYLRRKGEYGDARRPDLVLLDLNMPRMDGREVLREIRKDENLRSLPVVVLTTSAGDEDVLEAYNLNVNCYISKPVDFERFVHIVRQLNNFWFTIVELPPEP